MKAFRSWLTWIFKGRAELLALQRELRAQIEQHSRSINQLDKYVGVNIPDLSDHVLSMKSRLDGIESRISALEPKPQSVPQSKPVTKHRSFREFVAQVEREDGDGGSN